MAELNELEDDSMIEKTEEVRNQQFNIYRDSSHPIAMNQEFEHLINKYSGTERILILFLVKTQYFHVAVSNLVRF